MGRQQHLTRLALGRSPFEDAEADDNILEQVFEGFSRAEGVEQPDAQSDGQQYNTKGRPINLSSEERKIALRNAQNAVLSLVGVVESKDTTPDRLAGKWHRELYRSQKREDDRGEDIEALTAPFQAMLLWWPHILIQRIQIGFYDPSLSFAGLISSSFRPFGWTGIRGLRGLFPGAPVYLLRGVIQMLYYKALAISGLAAVSLLGKWVMDPRAPPSRKRYQIGIFLQHAIGALRPVLFAAIDIALLPLEYHALTLQLGLAPAWPWVPSWRWFLPWHPTSFHSFAWSAATTIPQAGILLSPAALMLTRRYMTREVAKESFDDNDNDTDCSSCSDVDEWQSSGKQPNMFRKPFDWLSYGNYRLRMRFTRWCGWCPPEKDPSSQQLANKNNDLPPPPTALRTLEVPPGDDPSKRLTVRVHLFTKLADLPAQLLDERIDRFLQRIILLPLQALTVRAVAASYMASSLPKTPPALAAASHLYAPFGRGPLSGLRNIFTSAPARREVGGYLSRLGLSLAVYCAAEVGIFFVTYGLARWQGVRKFGWGNLRRITDRAEQKERERESRSDVR